MKKWIEEHFSDDTRAMTTISVICLTVVGIALVIFVGGLLFARS
jgi:hypothetical protein